MSCLRDELSAARRAYAGTRYPGDLSRELLPLPLPALGMRWRGIVIFGTLGAGAAAAAAIVAAMLLRPLLTPATAQPRPYLPVVKEIHLPKKLQFDVPSLPSIPGLPDNLSLRAVTPGLGLPSDWAIPLWDALPISNASEFPEPA